MNSLAEDLPADARSTPVESEIARIRELTKRGMLSEALKGAEALNSKFPENRDALYLTALNQRQLRRTADALQTLDRLEQAHPGFSRLYQERGHCYVALRDSARAIDSFLRGVNINPALPASWSMLEGLYRFTGDAANASIAAQHVATLKKQPPDVVTATGLFADGEWAAAESIIRSYLIRHGDQVEAMRLLARIGIFRGVFDDAELLLQGVLAMAPDYEAARQEYALVLIERHKYQQARAELDPLLQRDPGNLQLRTLYATACVGLGEQAKAVPLYRDLLRDAPGAADLHLSIAHCLKTLGQRDQAIEAYRKAAEVRPNYGDPYWSLANLKTYRFLDEEILRMRTEEDSPSTPLLDRYHLCFALGKAYEDRAEYAQSWHFYARGNALKRSESRYRPEILENNTCLQKKICTAEFFAARHGVGEPASDPIFILGLPRSGSTLVEQILASHSRVEGTQELSDIQRFVLEMQGREPNLDDPRYPAALLDLAPADLLKLGQRYLADTRAYRNSGRPFFIDKMPNNFRHIGLIHLILPNAKIIDARREPMACCFSNLKQLFANGQEFSYSIEDIARYYRTYLELMRHWNAVLPGRVLHVQHEDVVDDLGGSVRRILDFCELEFEPGCVDFHKTERSVRTASSEQVRQPIFREGLDQWKHYEPWLGALKEALGEALTRYRD